MKKNLAYKLRNRINYYANNLLYWYFRFDKWHRSPYTGRAYAMSIANYLNGRTQNETIVEIGCGLGSIIRNTNFKYKKGLDADKNALKAASFLNKFFREKNISLAYFKFPDSNLEGKFDAIIMVNWIHNIEPQILNVNIQDYFKNNLNKNGILIMDAVKSKNYKFHHDINTLKENLDCGIEKIFYDKSVGREVFAIIK